jgi:DNA-binding CsgD family transcriptional regulator
MIPSPPHRHQPPAYLGDTIMEENTALSEQLHDREMAILKRLAAGLSDQQIANDLCLSLHTVKWYNRQIYGKLGVKSRTQAIVCAQNLGVLHNDSAGVSLPVPSYQFPVQNASFIGRSRELSEVRQLLSRSRLLTLTAGASGSRSDCGYVRRWRPLRRSCATHESGAGDKGDC